MIKPVTYYTVACDNCGAEAFANDEYTAWNDAQFAEDCASEIGYTIDGEKHYCPKCYEYDDNDNLIINPPAAQ